MKLEPCSIEQGLCTSVLYITAPLKKVREFPVPSRDVSVTTKLSLGGNNDVITELFLPRGSLVSDIPAGDGKLENLFLRCGYRKEGIGVPKGVGPSTTVIACPGFAESILRK
jgi:hypothetical protein